MRHGSWWTLDCLRDIGLSCARCCFVTKPISKLPDFGECDLAVSENWILSSKLQYVAACFDLKFPAPATVSVFLNAACSSMTQQSGACYVARRVRTLHSSVELRT